MPDRWCLTYEARPISLNRERTMHHHDRADFVTEWRDAFHLLARQQRIPRLEAITVEVHSFYDKGNLPDTGNCYPSAKAAIDGLIDAGVIADDGPKIVRRITFTRPLIDRSLRGPSLVLCIHRWTED